MCGLSDLHFFQLIERRFRGRGNQAALQAYRRWPSGPRGIGQMTRSHFHFLFNH